VAEFVKVQSVWFWVGAALVVIACASLGYELALAAETGSYRMVAAGEIWFKLSVGTLNLTQAIIQRYIHPAIWDPVIAGLLQWPLWSIAGAPGAFLTILFARRSVHAN
jgi:hypothetical protein